MGKLRWVLGGSVLGVLSWAAACSDATLSEGGGAVHSDVTSQTAFLGEPVDTFPNWHEQVILVWTNRARADPAADLASCSACAEKACYSPVPPLVWEHNLGRAARFHSDNIDISGCGLQHASPCTVVSDIDVQYRPGPCSGDPACACVPASLSCGSTGTGWSTRISLFGTPGSGENIAYWTPPRDPIEMFYLWFHEPDTNSSCGFRSANGHRANILGNHRSVGVGKAATAGIYTQDFGNTGTPNKIVSGIHHPQTGSSLDFRANWYAGTGPVTAMLSVEGDCHAMTLERGSSTNGTYHVAIAGIASGCQRYVFHFTDGSGDVFYPSTGSYGIGCAEHWQATRPAPCGACTPDCSGRTCGDDGCGGSCGSCTSGLTCGAGGSCVCTATLCSGSCIDTDSDPENCGGCGVSCGPSENCVAGTCQCAPSCGGRQCGDNGCGGSCGSCASDRTCDGSGSCECTSGTECGGGCVDTDTDDRNCGSCGVRCRGMDYCVAGVCGVSCTPDCAGRECGNDGCGGACGTCPTGMSCDITGSCNCPSGTTDCGGSCVDADSDAAHCGTCGNACASMENCISGSCTSTCVPDCAGKACGNDGCGGSCGVCGSASNCDGAGACVCNPGTTDCGGTCVDVDADTRHCGACGNRCTASEVCASGACSCVPSCGGRECGGDGCGGSCGSCAGDEVCSGGSCVCGAGLTDCGGACVDLRIDVAHCGVCDSACAPTESCVSGSCVRAGGDAGCAPDCDGRNCGGDACGGVCGACGAAEICGAGGACLCSAETTDCEGTCVDTRIDGAHCGTCNRACSPGQRCAAGSCGGMAIDAGVEDAGIPALDGGAGAVDAASTTTPLAVVAKGGCECRVRGHGRGSPGAPIGLSLVLVALLWRRRRVR